MRLKRISVKNNKIELDILRIIRLKAYNDKAVLIIFFRVFIINDNVELQYTPI